MYDQDKLTLPIDLLIFDLAVQITLANRVRS